MDKSSQEHSNEVITRTKITKRIAATAVLVGVGLVLSYLNPFAYFEIQGSKINPFAHMINGLAGVLVGLTFAVTAATILAILRYSLAIGTILAFPGGISGAIITGTASYFLRKKFPKYADYASFLEPIGTVFIGGTLADFFLPVAGVPSFEGILFWWVLFAGSSIFGCILGFVSLKVLRDQNITWETFL
jgi:energy coupling factor transporter S component ThiW